MNIQDWFSLGWTDLISLLSKGLLRVFSSTTVQIQVDGIIIYPIAHFSNLGYTFNIASSFPFSYQIHHWVLSFLIFIFTLFYFTILYWFCHTLTWIHHGCFLLLLKYNCFTMLYLFLLYNEVNQLYVCTHPLPLGSSSHTPHHPTLLGITEHWASFLHYRAAPL